jgi:hypothetical protein
MKRVFATFTAPSSTVNGGVNRVKARFSVLVLQRRSETSERKEESLYLGRLGFNRWGNRTT